MLLHTTLKSVARIYLISTQKLRKYIALEKGSPMGGKSYPRIARFGYTNKLFEGGGGQQTDSRKGGAPDDWECPDAKIVQKKMLSPLRVVTEVTWTMECNCQAVRYKSLMGNGISYRRARPGMRCLRLGPPHFQEKWRPFNYWKGGVQKIC